MKKKKLRKIIKQLKKHIFDLTAQPEDDVECKQCETLGNSLLKARSDRDEKLRLLTFQQHRNVNLENENKNLKLKLAHSSNYTFIAREVEEVFDSVCEYLTSVNDYQMRNYKANFGTDSTPLEKITFLKNKVVAEFSIFKQKQS